MERKRASEQLDAIWSFVVRNEVFRGYRPVTVGLSALLGLAAALVQERVVPDPAGDSLTYLLLWGGVAIMAVTIVSVDLWFDGWRNRSIMDRQLTWRAVRQFLPALGVGLGLSICSEWNKTPPLPMLPGLWALCFALGIFSSIPYMNKAIFWVGTYYACAGFLLLLSLNEQTACSPWSMGLTFGVGQLLSAWVLFSTRRMDGEQRR